jgi:hypothetical protein
MKKVKVKITHKSLMVNLEFPLEVGQVKMNAECQAFIYKDRKSGELDGDFEFMDYKNTTYMGMPIDGYGGMQKLKAFHTELGIDLSKLINDEFDKVITEEFQKDFIKQFNIEDFDFEY